MSNIRDHCPKCKDGLLYQDEDGLACFCGYHSYGREIVKESKGDDKKPRGAAFQALKAKRAEVIEIGVEEYCHRHGIVVGRYKVVEMYNAEMRRRGLTVQSDIKVDQKVDQLPKPLPMLLDYLQENVAVWSSLEHQKWAELFSAAINRLYPVER